jgi:cellobiose phosphorylase
LSPRQGASRILWLSGSATWTYHAICRYILGIRPEYQGLSIDLFIPSTWKCFKEKRRFRVKHLTITVKNSHAVEQGAKEIDLNGTPLQSNFIPTTDLKNENEVRVIIWEQIP